MNRPMHEMVPDWVDFGDETKLAPRSAESQNYGAETPAQRVWLYATTNGVPRRSLAVAIVVGSVLNLINQGDAIFGGGSINFLKLALTYTVPYCVSTYGAVAYRLSVASQDLAAASKGPQA